LAASFDCAYRDARPKFEPLDSSRPQDARDARFGSDSEQLTMSTKENCAFRQCDSGAGTTMWTIAKTHQTPGKSAILNPSVRIAPVRTEAADLDARQSGYRRRAFTFGLITTCGNAPAVSGSVAHKAMALF